MADSKAKCQVVKQVKLEPDDDGAYQIPITIPKTLIRKGLAIVFIVLIGSAVGVPIAQDIVKPYMPWISSGDLQAHEESFGHAGSEQAISQIRSTQEDFVVVISDIQTKQNETGDAVEIIRNGLEEQSTTQSEMKNELVEVNKELSRFTGMMEMYIRMQGYEPGEP